MVRRTQRWRAPKVHIDYAALFVTEAKKIVRYSALLSAYRRSTGVYIRAERTALAQERLAVAVQQCRDAHHQTGFPRDVFVAMEQAAKIARLSYTGHWWSSELRNGVPDDMGPGDEYFSWRTVRDVIERMRDPVPDVEIEAGSARPLRVSAAG